MNAESRRRPRRWQGASLPCPKQVCDHVVVQRRVGKFRLIRCTLYRNGPPPCGLFLGASTFRSTCFQSSSGGEKRGMTAARHSRRRRHTNLRAALFFGSLVAGINGNATYRTRFLFFTPTLKDDYRGGDPTVVSQ